MLHCGLGNDYFWDQDIFYVKSKSVKPKKSHLTKFFLIMFEEKGSMCNFEENLWNKKFDQNHYGTPMQFDGIIAKLMDSFFFVKLRIS